MDTILTGFIVCFLITTFLIVLFKFERGRSVRIGERFRVHLDQIFIRAFRVYSTPFFTRGKDALRQTAHYILHQFLRIFLLFVKKIEDFVRRIMHVNKKLAKHNVKESDQKTKLEELSLHKASIAMTESQKKKHKEKTLKGF